MRATWPEWILYDWRACENGDCNGALVEFRRNVNGTIYSHCRCMICDYEAERIVKEAGA